MKRGALFKMHWQLSRTALQPALLTHMRLEPTAMLLRLNFAASFVESVN